MKRLTKLALIPAAVTAVLAGNAYAGTEACFEILKPADLALLDISTVYAPAQCTTTGNVRHPDLAGLAPTKIAFELTTSSFQLDFSDVDGDADAVEAADDQVIVYIPTTDIPGSARVKIKLNGATFGSNNNQIHLVKDNGAGGYEAVASSDGQVDGQGEITFLVKSGTTVGAGTRLALSLSSLAVEPIKVAISNAETCTSSTSSASVSIQSTFASTDGSTSIAGGVSKATQLVNITPQFVLFDGYTASATAQVNAETGVGDSRTDFVVAGAATADTVTFSTNYLDTGVSASFDRYIDLAAVAAKLDTKFYATGDFADMHIDVAGTDYTINTDENGVTVYEIDEATIFTGAAVDYVLTHAPVDSVMEFGYTVSAMQTLDFNDTAYKNHCSVTNEIFNIGVNGAVLKVPYAVNGEGNFVRITNEHNKSAEVSVDVFGESEDGTVTNRKVTAVSLGSVPAQSSVVYFVPTILAEAKAANFDNVDGNFGASAFGSNAAASFNRLSLNFTVTAPKDKVHGVTVQRVSGGVDRVMPVLDQNAWSQ